jgi:energy-coupling factor transporter ATP-binding protein EcfA2
MSGAERRMMIGTGLAGGVIRNLLLDMFEKNQAERTRLKADSKKIKDSDLKNLRNSDPWELLQKSLGEIFGARLEVTPLNDFFHTNIKVQIVKGSLDGYKFTKRKGYKPRDIMSEESGFLQWLSVYALALSAENDVLLLDEPDAHLHPSLQSVLIEILNQFAKIKNKQILLATHSTEILRSASYDRIFEVQDEKGAYLSSPDRKVGLFAGLGSSYAPKLDPLRRHRRLLLVESESDARMLMAWARAMRQHWPDNIVVWPWTGHNQHRKHLFLQLVKEVPGLSCIRIRDRDDQCLNTIDKNDLTDKGISSDIDGLKLKVWRRRHIENYCLWPPAIARAANVDENDVRNFFADNGLNITPDVRSQQAAFALLDARGKELTTVGERSVRHRFRVKPIQVAEAMMAEEIPEDVSYLIREILQMGTSINLAF